VALTSNYNFADISRLLSDSRNSAQGFLKDSAVAGHPSDFGMVNIADIFYINIIDSEWYKKMVKNLGGK